MPLKRRFALRTLTLALTVTLLGACASSKKLDEKLNQEVQVQNQRGLADEYHNLVLHSPGLKDSQRTALLALRDSVRQKNTELNQESVRLRSVLIKDVLNPKYDEHEVNLIKSRISKLERKRTDLLFDTVDRANEILGRETDFDKNQLMEGLLRPDLQRGDF